MGDSFFIRKRIQISKIDIIKQGESLPFVFDRNGESLDGYICTLFVKQFPDDFPSIERLIEKSRNEETHLEEWSGFLTTEETTGLNEGLWYLIVALINEGTDEEERQSIRFNVSPSLSTPSIPSIPFIPTDLFNLVSWHDAADTSTITSDVQNDVLEWRDKSGKGYHLIQPSLVQPGVTGPPRSGINTLNGLNVITYLPLLGDINIPSTLNVLANETYATGSDTLSEATLFCVSSLDDSLVNSRQSLYFISDNIFHFDPFIEIDLDSGVIDPTRNEDVFLRINNILRRITLGRLVVPATRTLIMSNTGAVYTRFGQIVGNLFYNGTIPINANFLSLGSHNFIPSHALSGDIAEFIVYNRALSLDDVIKVEQYLSDKWNVPAIE